MYILSEKLVPVNELYIIYILELCGCKLLLNQIPNQSGLAPLSTNELLDLINIPLKFSVLQ